VRPSGRPRPLFAVLALGLLLSACGDGGSSAASSGGDASPVPRDVPGLEGGRVALRGDDRPTAIAFVAAWCAPCKRELPELERLSAELTGVRFVALAVEEEPAATRRLVEQTGITFDVGRDDDGEVLAAAGIVGLPGMVLLDRDGRIAERLRGAQTAAELRPKLERLAE